MSAGTSKLTDVLLRAAAAPPLALAAFALLLGLGVPPLPEWFWPTPNTNVAEAAALGDAARVLALASDGMPVDTALPVREGIRSSGEPAMMTPLEAATSRGHDELVQLLLELGAGPSAEAAITVAP